MLAASGNEDAISYLKNMGIENGLMKSRNALHGKTDISEDDAKRLMTGACLGIEARYAAITRILKESKSTNVFDIACGYTPRAYSCYKDGFGFLKIMVSS